MAGRVFWWTCHHPRCLDRMSQTDDPERVRRDRDAHIQKHRDDGQPYDYSEHELALSSWHESDIIPTFDA